MTNKIIQYHQDITIDPIHGWGTSIIEYAIPEYQIIFNYYGEQINVMDGVYYTSRFLKGQDKKEIEVPDELVLNVIKLNRAKQEIIKDIQSLESQATTPEGKL
jgi:hypothetical protein